MEGSADAPDYHILTWIIVMHPIKGGGDEGGKMQLFVKEMRETTRPQATNQQKCSQDALQDVTNQPNEPPRTEELTSCFSHRRRSGWAGMQAAGRRQLLHAVPGLQAT